jgi:hypothetical protein
MAIASDADAANALKAKGNKAFAQHDWAGAVNFYTQAIEKNNQDPSFFCNRAQVGPSCLAIQSSQFTNRRRQISSLNPTVMPSQMLLMR